MNIIPTDARSVPSWWAAWIALMLLVFGLPALTARLLLLPGDATRLALLEGETVSAENLGSFGASRLRVASWFSVNTVSNDMAVYALERAKGQTSGAANVFYDAAEAWQIKALRTVPADSYGWFRLAYLSMRKDGVGPRAAAAWNLSLASAPYEPRLLLSRLRFAIRLGDYLGADAKARIPHLIRDLMVYDRDGLIRAAQTDAFVSVVESALADDAAKLEEFHQHLAKP